MTFIDTNVLLDLSLDDPGHAAWSQAQLETAKLRGPLLIVDAVYAELSVGYDRAEDVDAFVAAAELRRVSMPTEALFLAGKAFLAYRRRGGSRSGVMPDFFIGAVAAVRRIPLLTRDAARYRTYFPTVDLIAP